MLRVYNSAVYTLRHISGGRTKKTSLVAESRFHQNYHIPISLSVASPIPPPPPPAPGLWLVLLLQPLLLSVGLLAVGLCYTIRAQH